MKALEILQSSLVFAELPVEHLESIAQMTHVKNFSAGDLIIQEGDEPDYCYLINIGTIQIYRALGVQKKFILGEVGEGNVLGELSIIDGLPRAASALALTPVETLVFSKGDFGRLLKAHPEIAVELLPVLANRLRKTHDELYLSMFMHT